MSFWWSVVSGFSAGFLIAWWAHRRLYAAVRARDHRRSVEWFDAILCNTYDRQAVDEAILAIDKFDAGAVDGPLREHIMKVFRRLREADKARDARIAELARELLEGKSE
ncbi:MAG: hypothetical protein ACTSWI_00140 [Alphaproteobacteria bacterium]